MSLESTDIGRWLLAAHENGQRFEPFADAKGIADLAAAYRAQDSFIAAQQAAGKGAIKGWKIGLTSQRMQEMCGIDHPVSGAVLESRLWASGVTASLARFGRLGIEFEIAVKLGADLPARRAGWSLEEVRAAVAGIAPAIEMIDDRNSDYAVLELRALVADNSWNAGVVFGAWGPLPEDLESCEGIAALDGAEIDRGHGRDVLGGPLKVLHWLANHLSERGRGLAAGDIVMTGSLMPTRFPAPGSSYEFALAGIGRVVLNVEA